VGFEGGRDGSRLSAKYAADSDSSATKSLRVPESPPPPTRKSVRNVLNWGALNDSLTHQETNNRAWFPFNESLSTVKSARNGKLGTIKVRVCAQLIRAIKMQKTKTKIYFPSLLAFNLCGTTPP